MVICAWASVSRFLLHNSATVQFQVLMSMQMDAEFKKEQIGTLFVWVGALEGEFGGLVVPQGCPPQKVKNDLQLQSICFYLIPSIGSTSLHILITPLHIFLPITPCHLKLAGRVLFCMMYNMHNQGIKCASAKFSAESVHQAGGQCKSAFQILPHSCARFCCVEMTSR